MKKIIFMVVGFLGAPLMGMDLSCDDSAFPTPVTASTPTATEPLVIGFESAVARLKAIHPGEEEETVDKPKETTHLNHLVLQMAR